MCLSTVKKYFSVPRNLLIRGLLAGYKLSLYQGCCQRNEDRLINIDNFNKYVVTLYFLKRVYYYRYKTRVPAIYGLKSFLIRKTSEQAFKSYVIANLIYRGVTAVTVYGTQSRSFIYKCR